MLTLRLVGRLVVVAEEIIASEQLKLACAWVQSHRPSTVAEEIIASEQLKPPYVSHSQRRQSRLQRKLLRVSN